MSVDKSHSLTLSEVTECEASRGMTPVTQHSPCERAHKTLRRGGSDGRATKLRTGTGATSPSHKCHAIDNWAAQSVVALDLTAPRQPRADRKASASADRRQHGRMRGPHGRCRGREPPPCSGLLFSAACNLPVVSGIQE